MNDKHALINRLGVGAEKKKHFSFKALPQVGRHTECLVNDHRNMAPPVSFRFVGKTAAGGGVSRFAWIPSNYSQLGGVRRRAGVA